MDCQDQNFPGPLISSSEEILDTASGILVKCPYYVIPVNTVYVRHFFLLPICGNHPLDA